MGGVQLLLSDSRGVYIPRDFIEFFDLNQWNIDSKYMERLSSPDDELYWDNWNVVLNNAKHTDKQGNVWTLWQDGDLWAICHDLMTEEEKQNFGFED